MKIVQVTLSETHGFSGQFGTTLPDTRTILRAEMYFDPRVYGQQLVLDILMDESAVHTAPVEFLVAKVGDTVDWPDGWYYEGHTAVFDVDAKLTDEHRYLFSSLRSGD